MIGKTQDHPGPGVYPGLPDAEYHAWDLPSNSRLSDLNVSPEQCAWMRRHGKEQTDAMKLGTATHTGLLEPERLAREFVEPQPCSGTINKTGKRCGAMSARPYGSKDDPTWLCGRHNKDMGEPLEVETLTPAQRISMGHMVTSAHRFDSAAKLLKISTARELSIIFEMHGTLWKARVDLYSSAAGGILGDVKTCPDPTEDAFGRKVFTMGYLRQLAMYRRALQAIGLPVEYATIIAIQSSAPYAVRTYDVPGELIDLGEQDLDRLIADYLRRERDNDWIGCGGEAVTLELPEWAIRKTEHQIANANYTLQLETA